MKGVGYMTYTVVRLEEEIKIIWLHFRGTVIISILSVNDHKLVGKEYDINS